MKSFSKYISEVAQPSERGAEEEQAFKDQHTYEVIPHPVALDHQFTGDIPAADAARPADNKNPESTYDTAYAYGMNTMFDKAGLGLGESADDEAVDESVNEDAAHSDKHVNMAIGIASDKRYKGGNMTGAVKAMNKMKPGISDHPKVAAVLKRQNEDIKAEALSPKQKELDHDKDGDIDGADFAKMRAKAKKKKPLAASYNEELDETTNSALLKPVTTTGVDGKKRTVMKTAKPKITDDNGQDKIITNESILKELAENVKFKVGMMKLKDGKSVVLKKQDADLLTQMFKDLSPNNRKKLGVVAMKDQSGFDEILGFAREAL
tara:strand:- start:2590 stop:3552 length:963 start_codon:yes stop_codon:yes gene_type:complete